MFCKNCGNQLADDSNSCSNCGTKIETPAVQNNQMGGLSKPLTIKNYLAIFFLMLIPIVGIVLIFVWAFGSDVNINKKNYARAQLIYALILFGISLLFSSVLIGIITNLISSLAY